MSELEIWNELGNIYFNAEAYDEAIRTYQKAIELGHGCGQSYSNLASIFILQERYAEAVPMLKKGLQILDESSSQACLWNQLGEAYLKLEDFENAVSAYQKAAELDPENTAFQDNLAEAELVSRHANPESTNENGQEQVPMVDSIGKEMEPATIPETQPGGPDLAQNSGPESPSWVFQNNRLSALVEQNSTDLPAVSPVILGSRILSDVPVEGDASPLEQAEKPVPSQAVSSGFPNENSFEKVGETKPAAHREPGGSTNERAHGLLRLGIIHWRKGEYEKAIQFLEVALETVVRPQDNFLEALCYNAIALVETDLGKTVDAIQAYQSAASLAPERIFPWNRLGNLNCMLDRFEDALAAFREGIDHNPKDSVSWNGLADVYHKLGRNEDAIAAYQLGNVFEKQNDEENVFKEFEKSIETDQANPAIWDGAGNIYYSLRAYEDAIAAYRTAVQLDPVNQSFQANLAKAEQAFAEVLSKNKLSKQEPLPESSHQPEPVIAGNSSPKTEESNALQSSLPDDQPIREEQGVPEQLPDQPGVSRDPEPEAAYWVFETDKPVKNALQPARRYNAAGQETDVSTAKPIPTFTMQAYNQQAFPDGQVLAGADNKDTSELLVQVPPRTSRPTREEERIHRQVIDQTWENAASKEDSEIRKPAPMTAQIRPVPQAAAPEIQVVDRNPIDFNVLENDIARYRRVTELNPRNDRAWDALGNMYEAAGLHKDAISAFEQAIALDPRKDAFHYHLGVALAYEKDFDKAIQALEHAVFLNPNFVLAHCALAACYRRVDKDSQAQEHIAIARPSMENENEYNRACFESISGNNDRALMLLKIALEKQQIQIGLVRSDPDLDFIRSDARFGELFS
jgi:tetratricopeptide (TPR) repeat protein